MWILATNDTEHLAQLQTQWPGGRVQEHLLATRVPIFTSYLVLDDETSVPTVASQTEPDKFTAYLPDGRPLIPR